MYVYKWVGHVRRSLFDNVGLPGIRFQISYWFTCNLLTSVDQWQCSIFLDEHASLSCRVVNTVKSLPFIFKYCNSSQIVNYIFKAQ